MKLLYSFIIWGLIQQSFVLKPLTASTSFRVKIVEFFNHELLTIDKEFCEKAKHLSEKILQDAKIQQAATPKLKEFKQNITDFLHDYPSYQRYGLINELVFLLQDKLPEPENNKNIEYIRQLLKKLGYNDISLAYETKYVKFVKEKFLQKFEELNKQFPAKELKQQQYLIHWFNGVKKCRDYNCYSIFLNSLISQQSEAKRKLLEYITAQLDSLNIFYGNQAYDISKGLQKNQKLSQLTPSISQQLSADLNNYIRKYESHQTIDELYNLTRDFYIKILLKYYHNTKNIPTKQHKLLVKIFDEQGCKQLITNYEHKLLEFVKHGLLKKFKQFKAALSRKELGHQKPLIQWYDELKGLNSTLDMVVMFDKFHTMFYDKSFNH